MVEHGRQDMKAKSKKPEVGSVPSKEWAVSGERALRAAEAMLKHSHYNYACYIGQEALELYVKAFLRRNDSAVDLKTHETWKPLLDMICRRTNRRISGKKVGAETKRQVMNTLKQISDIFQTKMSNESFKQELWQRHIKDPNSILCDDVFVLKSSASLKSKIIDTAEMIEQGDQSFSVVVTGLIQKITGENSIIDLAKSETHPKMDFTVIDKLSKKEKEPLVEFAILLCSIYWLPTMFIAYSHQQYSRYPEKIKNRVDYTNSSYTYDTAKAFLERVNNTIEKIKTSLNGEI